MPSDSSSHSPHGPGTPLPSVLNFFEIPGSSFSSKRNGRTPVYFPPRAPTKSSVGAPRMLSRTIRPWETPLAQAVSFKEDRGEMKELLNSKRTTPTGSVRKLQHSEFRDSASMPLGNDTCDESAGSTTSYFHQCFEVLSPLGSGSFGDVFEARCRADGLRYAVKRSQCKYRGERDRKRKLNEVSKHENVPHHPNLLRFYRAWEERQRLYIQVICSSHCHSKLHFFQLFSIIYLHYIYYHDIPIYRQSSACAVCNSGVKVAFHLVTGPGGLGASVRPGGCW
uniref:non-specific serine/threonine protein kinase n=1 Tax=Eptatretus burgeri TaxID=7764 RepID=A0A8C4R670_EPTBU